MLHATLSQADNGPADLPSVNCWAIGSPGPYTGDWQRQKEGGGGSAAAGTCKSTTWEVCAVAASGLLLLRSERMDVEYAHILLARGELRTDSANITDRNPHACRHDARRAGTEWSA